MAGEWCQAKQQLLDEVLKQERGYHRPVNGKELFSGDMLRRKRWHARTWQPGPEMHISTHFCEETPSVLFGIRLHRRIWNKSGTVGAFSSQKSYSEDMILAVRCESSSHGKPMTAQKKSC